MRHSATTTVSRTSPVPCRRPDAQREDERRQPGAGGPAHVPLSHACQVEFGAGQEHQVGQPEVRQGGDDGVRVREVEHEGPDDDAEHDLDDDLGDRDEPPGHSAMIGARTAATPMSSKRRDGGSLSSVVSPRRVDRPSWHALATSGATR